MHSYVNSLSFSFWIVAIVIASLIFLWPKILKSLTKLQWFKNFRKKTADKCIAKYAHLFSYKNMNSLWPNNPSFLFIINGFEFLLIVDDCSIKEKSLYLFVVPYGYLDQRLLVSSCSFSNIFKLQKAVDEIIIYCLSFDDNKMKLFQQEDQNKKQYSKKLLALNVVFRDPLPQKAMDLLIAYRLRTKT